MLQLILKLITIIAASAFLGYRLGKVNAQADEIEHNFQLFNTLLEAKTE